MPELLANLIPPCSLSFCTPPSVSPFAGDTLGGHVDDAELDLHQPIVTVSLGCEAVFLAGGLTRVCPLNMTFTQA